MRASKEVQKLRERLREQQLENLQLLAKISRLERVRQYEASRSVFDEQHEHALEVCSFTNTADLFNGVPEASLPVGEVRRWRNGWLALYLTHMPLNGRLLLRPKV